METEEIKNKLEEVANKKRMEFGAKVNQLKEMFCSLRFVDDGLSSIDIITQPVTISEEKNPVDFGAFLTDAECLIHEIWELGAEHSIVNECINIYTIKEDN